MTDEFKKVCEGILCFFLLSVQWTAALHFEDGNQIVNHQSTEPRAKLGEACVYKSCEENLFCVAAICQCPPGYKVYNNECTPAAGEFDPCTKNEDCCGHLLCINGICRKPGPNTEFVTLAKICLGITVTTIIIAVFSSIIKCLFRYDNSRVFQRHSDTSSFGSLPYRGQMVHQVHPGPDMYDLLDEKPPSYEECIRSGGGRPAPLEPPPYVISTNTVTSTTEVSRTVPSANLTVPNQQNLTTPLNVQSLSHDVNSNAIATESSAKSDSRNGINSSS